MDIYSLHARCRRTVVGDAVKVRERFLWLALSGTFLAAGYFLPPENDVSATTFYICAAAYLFAAAFEKDPTE